MPVRREGRWSAWAEKRSMWLKGAGTSGQGNHSWKRKAEAEDGSAGRRRQAEAPGGGAGRRRRAFHPVLTGVANTSPRPGRRKVWVSLSQLRSFTWWRLFLETISKHDTGPQTVIPRKRESRESSRCLVRCARDRWFSDSFSMLQKPRNSLSKPAIVLGGQTGRSAKQRSPMVSAHPELVEGCAAKSPAVRQAHDKGFGNDFEIVFVRSTISVDFLLPKLIKSIANIRLTSSFSIDTEFKEVSDGQEAPQGTGTFLRFRRSGHRSRSGHYQPGTYLHQDDHR